MKGGKILKSLGVLITLLIFVSASYAADTPNSTGTSDDDSAVLGETDQPLDDQNIDDGVDDSLDDPGVDDSTWDDSGWTETDDGLDYNYTEDDPWVDYNYTEDDPWVDYNYTEDDPWVDDNYTEDDPWVDDNSTWEDPGLYDNYTWDEPVYQDNCNGNYDPNLFYAMDMGTLYKNLDSSSIENGANTTPSKEISESNTTVVSGNDSQNINDSRNDTSGSMNDGNISYHSSDSTNQQENNNNGSQNDSQPLNSPTIPVPNSGSQLPAALGILGLLGGFMVNRS